jgi:hypothetical protein
MVRRSLLIGLLACGLAARAAEPPVYHLLWFDTEDYIEPASDDAALRLAHELSDRGIRATFKIVGEKSRVLVERGRTDVVRALAAHDIGYHTTWHSVPPAPAEYLATMGLIDGAAEFDRRERDGLHFLEGLFGFTPSCYGQPGNSWAPQTNLALRRWGVRVYMDDGIQIGYKQQPFWFGGVLYIFNLGPYTVRTALESQAQLEQALRRADADIAALRQQGGGVMQTYYHPCEFATTEFWDAVNFSHGANPPRAEWKRPRLRTPESSENAYRLFLAFIEHVRKTPGVRGVTAREAPALFEPRDQAPPLELARQLASSIDVRDRYSAADQLLRLLDLPPQHVDGPARRMVSDLAEATITRHDFDAMRSDAAAFIRANHRLPDCVWTGSRRLSLADFTATLADDTGAAAVPLRRGRLEIENYVASDARRAYGWVIHPEGFAPESLLELARLQAWTLKPARLR